MNNLFKIRLENEKRDREDSAIKSNYIGKVGDKVKFTSIPNCIYSSQNDFGYFYIYKMLVDGSNEVIWKTSKYLEPDVEIEFSATVKAQSEFRGVKQTEITRARTKCIFN